MKKTIFIFIALMIFCAYSARAQFVQGRYSEMVDAVDKIAVEHTEAWKNVAMPGINEEKKSQRQRYYEMEKHVDAAIVRHFENNIMAKEQTILTNVPVGTFDK